MKLLFCRQCRDVTKLGYDPTSCYCGRVVARYREDGWHAEWNGEGYLLGISNPSLFEAIRAGGSGTENPEIDCWLMNSNPRVTINKELNVAESQ